jgi:hypothetical protein
MMGEMPESVFLGWGQFWAEEPFGPQVENLMRARIAACAAGSNDEDSFLPMTSKAED